MTAWLLTACCLLPAQTLPAQPTLVSAVPPRYPVAARNREVQGWVNIRFKLTAAGETTALERTSGHPLLVEAAKEAMRTWRFALPVSTSQTYETDFEFVFSGVARVMYDDVADTTVDTESYRMFTVKTPRFALRRVTTCPDDAVEPPSGEGSDADFVLLENWQPLAHYSYIVRLQGNGAAAWRGIRGNRIIGERQYTVDKKAAGELIEKIKKSEYWSLCNNNSVGGKSDLRTVIMTVRIGGTEKKVQDYGGQTQGRFWKLVQAVNDVTAVQQWNPAP